MFSIHFQEFRESRDACFWPRPCENTEGVFVSANRWTDSQRRAPVERAQEETMKHILPIKQKQIEQRQLEAEADKVSRIRTAEGAAEARRIEAKGEPDSRQKLADAEAYRLDLVGKANAGQMEREGALIAHYPLLIQKTLADKLSDKVQVIIAPTPAAGQFIGSNLIGAKNSTSPIGDASSTANTKAIRHSCDVALTGSYG
jgi:regulator of protease activity HflC (stomatin/prohibitin superfamily)